MFQDFWSGVSSGITGGTTEAWVNRIVRPALFFWGSGLMIAFIYKWQPLIAYLNLVSTTTTSTTETTILLVFVSFLVLILSDMVLDWLTLPCLRFMEGYWPSTLRNYFIHKKQREVAGWQANRDELDMRLLWNELDQKKQQGVALSHKEQEAYRDIGSEFDLPNKPNRVSKVEALTIKAKLSNYPTNHENLLPTQLGNILRAAEEYPELRYGLEITTTWPRLWLVLPTEVQREISTIRHALDQAIQFFMCGILFACWSYFTPWAALFALLIAGLAYKRILDIAHIYGDLLRSAYDLHRIGLYKQLRLKPPLKSDNEFEAGKKLTSYLEQRDNMVSVTFDTTP